MRRRYNNPIFLVWGEIMLDRLRLSRVRLSLRHARRLALFVAYERSLAHTPSAAGTAHPKDGKPRALSKPWLRFKLSLWGMRVMDHERDAHRTPNPAPCTLFPAPSAPCPRVCGGRTSAHVLA